MLTIADIQTDLRKTGARTSIQVASVTAVMPLAVEIEVASMPLAAATAIGQLEATHSEVCSLHDDFNMLVSPFTCFKLTALLTLFAANRTDTPRYGLSKTDIKVDLSDQRPIYPFSCYGPGRDAPRQLVEGPVEISPEELRARYYAQRASGNEPSAVCAR